MNLTRTSMFAGMVLAAAPAIALQTAPPPAAAASAGTSSSAADTAMDAAQQQLLSKAVDMIKAGQVESALQGPLAAVIESYEKRYGGNAKTRYYSVRSPQEALVYMAMAAKTNQDAVALGPAWGEAYFLKGSALNTLRRFDGARAALQQAVALAPYNSQYLIELAYSLEMQHQSEQALQLCATAEAMSSISPDDLKLAEQTRALRCEGFNLTDLHEYDKAIAKYEAALKLDPGDQRSKHELEYIRIQQAQAKPASSG